MDSDDQIMASNDMASRLAAIHANLLLLLYRAGGKVVSRTLTFSEVGELITYVSEIRHLLGELDSCGNLTETAALRPSLQDLWGRFLALEGELKELRNDAARAGRSTGPERYPQ